MSAPDVPEAALWERVRAFAVECAGDWFHGEPTAAEVEALADAAGEACELLRAMRAQLNPEAFGAAWVDRVLRRLEVGA